MLLIRKWAGLYSLFILTLLSVIAPPVVSADDEIPSGFKADRYQKVWERNPFTLVTPVSAQVRTTPFDKLFLVSWLNDGGKDVVFVQNSDTSEVQKVTKDPNPNNLRLVQIHKNADPQKADAILSNGAEQGSVKFRLEVPGGVSQAQGGQQPPGTTTGAAPGVPAGPGMTRQMQMQQNVQALQRAARVGAAQMQPGAAQTQPGAAQMQPGAAQTQPGAAQMQPGAAPAQVVNGTMAPRASEVRRKRITPPPPNEQPVGEPTPNQIPSNQSLSQ
jgi:hypothetical protein